MQFTSLKNNICEWLILVLLLGGLGHSMAANLSLSWDPSSDPGVTDYNIHYGTTSGSYPNQIAVSHTNAVTISNLTCGSTYYFAVTALDSNGIESEFSDEVQFLVPGILTVSPGLQPGDPILIKFPVAPNQSYEVQATADFQSWDTIWQTEMSTSNSWVQFPDIHAIEFPTRFYRLIIH